MAPVRDKVEVVVRRIRCVFLLLVLGAAVAAILRRWRRCSVDVAIRCECVAQAVPRGEHVEPHGTWTAARIADSVPSRLRRTRSGAVKLLARCKLRSAIAARSTRAAADEHVAWRQQIRALRCCHTTTCRLVGRSDETYNRYESDTFGRSDVAIGVACVTRHAPSSRSSWLLAPAPCTCPATPSM